MCAVSFMHIGLLLEKSRVYSKYFETFFLVDWLVVCTLPVTATAVAVAADLFRFVQTKIRISFFHVFDCGA